MTIICSFMSCLWGNKCRIFSGKGYYVSYNRILNSCCTQCRCSVSRSLCVFFFFFFLIFIWEGREKERGRNFDAREKHQSKSCLLYRTCNLGMWPNQELNLWHLCRMTPSQPSLIRQGSIYFEKEILVFSLLKRLKKSLDRYLYCQVKECFLLDEQLYCQENITDYSNLLGVLV